MLGHWRSSCSTETTRLYAIAASFEILPCSSVTIYSLYTERSFNSLNKNTLSHAYISLSHTASIFECRLGHMLMLHSYLQGPLSIISLCGSTVALVPRILGAAGSKVNCPHRDLLWCFVFCVVPRTNTRSLPQIKSRQLSCNFQFMIHYSSCYPCCKRNN